MKPLLGLLVLLVCWPWLATRDELQDARDSQSAGY